MATSAFDKGVPMQLPWLPMLVFVGFLLIAYAQATSKPPVAQPSPSAHALQKHGTDAIQAINITAAGNVGKHYRCKDDPPGYVKTILEFEPGRWAVVVYKGLRNITAFIHTSKVYHHISTDGCEELPQLEWQGR